MFFNFSLFCFLRSNVIRKLLLYGSLKYAGFRLTGGNPTLRRLGVVAVSVSIDYAIISCLQVRLTIDDTNLNENFNIIKFIF